MSIIFLPSIFIPLSLHSLHSFHSPYVFRHCIFPFSSSLLTQAFPFSLTALPILLPTHPQPSPFSFTASSHSPPHSHPSLPILFLTKPSHSLSYASLPILHPTHTQAFPFSFSLNFPILPHRIFPFSFPLTRKEVPVSKDQAIAVLSKLPVMTKSVG